MCDFAAPMTWFIVRRPKLWEVIDHFDGSLAAEFLTKDEALNYAQAHGYSDKRILRFEQLLKNEESVIHEVV